MTPLYRHPSILAIDPGTRFSAWAYLEDGSPRAGGKVPNTELRWDLVHGMPDLKLATTVPLVIEMIQGLGRPVGAETFETCVWIGRFAEAWSDPTYRIYRATVKRTLCGRAAGKDAWVRQALIDRFGGVDGKAKAVGIKSAPGPLYGYRADMWQALAVGITAYEGAELLID